MIKLEKGFWLIYKSKISPFIVGHYETREKPDEIMSIINSNPNTANGLLLIEER